MVLQYHPNFENAILSLREEFRPASRNRAKKPKGMVELSSVLMLGAKPDVGNASCYSVKDSKYAYSNTLHLGLMGLLPKTSLKEAVMNLRNGDHEDFLKYPLPCDVLSVCYIPYSIEGTSPDAVDGLKVSPRHFLSDVWVQAAQTAGAKIILTHGGRREIGPAHFARTGEYIRIPRNVFEEAYHHARPNGIYHSEAGVLVSPSIARNLAAYKKNPITEYLARELK